MQASLSHNTHISHMSFAYTNRLTLHRRIRTTASRSLGWLCEKENKPSNPATFSVNTRRPRDNLAGKTDLCRSGWGERFFFVLLFSLPSPCLPPTWNLESDRPGNFLCSPLGEWAFVCAESSAISAVPLLILRVCWLCCNNVDRFSISEKLLFLRCRVPRTVPSGSGVRALTFLLLAILNGLSTASIPTIALYDRRAGQRVIMRSRANVEWFLFLFSFVRRLYIRAEYAVSAFVYIMEWITIAKQTVSFNLVLLSYTKTWRLSTWTHCSAGIVMSLWRHPQWIATFIHATTHRLLLTFSDVSPRPCTGSAGGDVSHNSSDRRRIPKVSLHDRELWPVDVVMGFEDCEFGCVMGWLNCRNFLLRFGAEMVLLLKALVMALERGCLWSWLCFLMVTTADRGNGGLLGEIGCLATAGISPVSTSTFGFSSSLESSTSCCCCCCCYREVGEGVRRGTKGRWERERDREKERETKRQKQESDKETKTRERKRNKREARHTDTERGRGVQEVNVTDYWRYTHQPKILVSVFITHTSHTGYCLKNDTHFINRYRKRKFVMT